ncbi:caspase family protein [Bradyrhizobium sp. CW4]|uniref:caspase family protein n=1 Tax=Bradyrhizobium sp. CW4 TaxID=2782687 RepID=UPI001FFC1DA1|nr:caspase family protein [Bradyrhizobium sp. CW4]MCK1412527.1 caspase family protein [Bradyrhizobium sp. CW4]
MPGPAPTDTDRALVVGIERYPSLGLNPLKGPVGDAGRMADWLVNSAKARVTLITSDGSPESPWTVADLRPTMQDVTDSFVGYLRESNGRPTRRLARRLYVYMAGHGFMPEPRNLAIIAADALGDQYIPNVQATSWVDWFADQLYFDEYVLFMDCCTTRTFLYNGGKPLMKKTAERQDGRGKVVMAFAAGSDVETFEGPLADGRIGGFFTDKLLRGLKGAAAHGDGVVRTSGLISYFRNSLGVVGDGAVADAGSEHAVDPMFPERAELEFARVELPKYVFRAPLADDVLLQIFDTENRLIASGQIAQGAVTLPIGLGIYRARGPDGLSKVFEIASGTTGEVNLA